VLDFIQRGAVISVHKFKIGDTVFLEGSLNVPGAAYVIIRYSHSPLRSGKSICKSGKHTKRPHPRRAAGRIAVGDIRRPMGIIGSLIGDQAAALQRAAEYITDD
jgi:hypothetical protein